MFEWDEAKRLGNLAKHRLDFVRADLLFDGRARLDLPSTHAPEPRMITVARRTRRGVRRPGLDMARRSASRDLTPEGTS
ncbi:BrnT family toxin [Methylobacterium sp. J-092]|uniref:BrnT family toxin n=1 Tax=Methylobacterium sp. J-092 TaxID=2836667 RepID=UPI001FB970F0|nr:BrnT family toxin [Methylobacterium sp. J-092]MCJ2008049.1 BrnT family toxin [Methylobacterium sp. J-092]